MGASGRAYRLFKTSNGGASWSERPSPPNDGQLSFNNAIAVGLYSSDDLYVGQIELWRASDGGALGGLNNFRSSPPVTDKSWTNLRCCLSDANPFRRGLDLHEDIHDIVFAPYGSFWPSPSQIQILYVANDGGVTKGVVDFEGVVTWQSMTQGLAIGQLGTIGLEPRNPTSTVSGLWHNGNALTLTGFAQSLSIGAGDGFQATMDAATARTVYHNCNAGFGGAICRAKIPAFLFASPSEVIWSDNNAVRFWSDPYRQGHLLRLQAGLVFRAKAADTAPASVLNSLDAWEAIDPFFGKRGKTTTMAFRSRVLEEQTVYYLGTDTGQIWRGSPEVRWTKICECGASVNAIGPALLGTERIFAVFAGSGGPGRIKELARLADGTWRATNMDNNFFTDTRIAQVTSIVFDPIVRGSGTTTVYVGTDQGVYRGQFHEQVAQPLVVGPTLFDWIWTRSPGVPNIWVSDLEVHQSLQFRDQSGIIRAGTYGRGVFELQRSTLGKVGTLPVTLSVEAVRVGVDGAPQPLAITIGVATSRGKFTRDAPFQLTLSRGTTVSLEAPTEVRINDRILKFVGWAISGKRQDTRNRINLEVTETTQAIAYYESKDGRLKLKAERLAVAVAASVERLCVPGLSHQMAVSWAVAGGQESVVLVMEALYPDNHVETTQVKPLNGSQFYPMSFPKGGEVKIKMTATDSSGISSSAGATVQLKSCL